MKFLTNYQSTSWCRERGLKLSADRYLYYLQNNPHCFTIRLEEKPSRVIALADYLVPTWGDIPFEGALLWIRERGIWSDYSENSGAMIIEQMRLANGESESIEEYPGHLFEPDELFKMHSYFLIPLLFGWDAFVVPESGDYFAFVSHDGVAEVVARTADRANELRQRVENWKPQQDNDWYPSIVQRSESKSGN